LKEQLDQLSENLEKIRGNEGPAADEALASHALRTVLARQNLLISAMFNLTEMVEELLLASGKPRKAVFDDVEGEIQRVTLPPETPEGVAAATEATATEASLKVLPARRARFGSLARRRRRGVLAVLSALLLGLLLTWALPTLGGELARGFPFSDAREAETSPGAPEARSENEGAAQNPPAGDEVQGAGSSGAEVAGRFEVPDVSDRGVVEAARTLSRAGFEVTAMKAVKSEQEAGTVMRTKPAAGSAMERGKPVIVVMSGGPTGILPGLRGGGPASAATSQYTN
jgi:hypothetical protein